LSNPEHGIALVLHKDDTDKFYKLHASKVVEYIRKVYSIGLQDVYCVVRAEFITPLIFTPLISSSAVNFACVTIRHQGLDRLHECVG
jgi:hypothetical protein